MACTRFWSPVSVRLLPSSTSRPSSRGFGSASSFFGGRSRLGVGLRAVSSMVTSAAVAGADAAAAVMDAVQRRLMFEDEYVACACD